MMYLISVLCGFLFVFGATANELVFSHVPSSLKLYENVDTISGAELQRLPGDLLGAPSSSQTKMWPGLQIDFFNRPKTVFYLDIPGIDNQLFEQIVENKKELPSVKLNKITELTDFSAVAKNIMAIFPESLVLDFQLDANGKVLIPSFSEQFTRLHASYFSVDKGLMTPYKSLRASSGRFDWSILAEGHIIRQLLASVSDKADLVKSSNSPDFFAFTMHSLGDLIKKYGSDSTSVKDGVVFIRSIIDKINQVATTLYSDNYVLMVSTTKGLKREERPIIRKTRSLLSSTSNSLNLATADNWIGWTYIFNLMLWTTIGFWIVTFAVSYGLWYMDPGSDSVIYRMTSALRLKKD